jgi:hypothetical protein
VKIFGSHMPIAVTEKQPGERQPLALWSQSRGAQPTRKTLVAHGLFAA